MKIYLGLFLSFSASSAFSSNTIHLEAFGPEYQTAFEELMSAPTSEDISIVKDRFFEQLRAVGTTQEELDTINSFNTHKEKEKIYELNDSFFLHPKTLKSTHFPSQESVLSYIKPLLEMENTFSESNRMVMDSDQKNIEINIKDIYLHLSDFYREYQPSNTEVFSKKKQKEFEALFQRRVIHLVQHYIAILDMIERLNQIYINFEIGQKYDFFKKDASEKTEKMDGRFINLKSRWLDFGSSFWLLMWEMKQIDPIHQPIQIFRPDDCSNNIIDAYQNDRPGKKTIGYLYDKGQFYSFIFSSYQGRKKSFYLNDTYVHIRIMTVNHRLVTKSGFLIESSGKKNNVNISFVHGLSSNRPGAVVHLRRNVLVTEEFWKNLNYTDEHDYAKIGFLKVPEHMEDKDHLLFEVFQNMKESLKEKSYEQLKQIEISLEKSPLALSFEKKKRERKKREEILGEKEKEKEEEILGEKEEDENIEEKREALEKKLEQISNRCKEEAYQAYKERIEREQAEVSKKVAQGEIQGRTKQGKRNQKYAKKEEKNGKAKRSEREREKIEREQTFRNDFEEKFSRKKIKTRFLMGFLNGILREDDYSSLTVNQAGSHRTFHAEGESSTAVLVVPHGQQDGLRKNAALKFLCDLENLIHLKTNPSPNSSLL